MPIAPSREPWIKLLVGIYRSDKLAALPSDAARWGWIGVLTNAKTQRRMGVFASQAHLEDVLGKRGRFFLDYVKVGLLHRAPHLCEECARRNPEIKDGEVIVHDFLVQQRDPTNADRQLTWRESHNAERNGADNAAPNASANGTGNADRNGLLTRARNDRDGDSDRDVPLPERSPRATFAHDAARDPLG